MNTKSANIQGDFLTTRGAKSIETALKDIFPTRQEENRLQKARRIMGNRVNDLTDHELEVYISEFQYLIDSFMDEYEKKVFGNKTLKEILKEE